MGTIWHVGMAVPDLDKGLAAIGELFDLTWRPVVTRSMTIKDESGRPHDIDCHVTFSFGGPFAVEVWQAIPDTPLAMPESGYVHHLGYWVDDYAAERERLRALGYPPLLTSDPTLLISRGPGNILIEPCDLQRDQPYLRDLYPADSRFAGEPVPPPTRQAPAQPTT
jgi:catechol 2,3-dioxygenase-like lactoylglutathione lyase family enzyme